MSGGGDKGPPSKKTGGRPRGYHHTEETKQAISKAKIGIKRSKESIEKFKATWALKAIEKKRAKSEDELRKWRQLNGLKTMKKTKTGKE